MTHFGILSLTAAVCLAGASQLNGREPGIREAERPRIQRNDLIRISGTFEVVHYETEGEAYPAATLKEMKVVQKQSDWSFQVGGAITHGQDTIVAIGTHFSHIDCVYTDGPLKGQKVHGIVKVESDRVTYCWAGHNQPRPSAFFTGPDSGLTMFTVRRLSEAEAAERKKP